MIIFIITIYLCTLVHSNMFTEDRKICYKSRLDNNVHVWKRKSASKHKIINLKDIGKKLESDAAQVLNQGLLVPF